MKTWIRRTLVGLFGTTLLVGTLGAIVGCSHRSHSAMSEGERAEWRARLVDKAAGKLDLDATQKEKLAALTALMAAERGKVMGATDPRAELLGLVAGERFDRSRAQAFVEQRTSALREATPALVAATADFYDGLRPEQQAKLREYLQRSRRHGRHG